MMLNYFPLSLALGEAFCNRKQEKKRLTANLKVSAPTLISSPRRFGKTSLVIETLQKEKIKFVQIDFFSATSIEDILSSILNGIGKAITLVQPNFNKALELAKDFFSNIQVKIEWGKAGLNINLNKNLPNPTNEINNSLSKLELLLKKYNKKIVLFFDEFQTIEQIKSNISIEATIRSHVQMPSNITYIFSGSNRHLLGRIFDDRRRPFYKLCDRLMLNRISAEDYIDFFNHVAEKRWKKQITQSVLNEILNLTDRHPFYVNALCYKIWQNETIPTIGQVRDCWNLLAQEQKPQIAIEIDLLSLNQKKILSSLAKCGRNTTIQSKEFMSFAGMASSSLHQALKTMIKKDFIEATGSGAYKIIDPMLEFLLGCQA